MTSPRPPKPVVAESPSIDSAFSPPPTSLTGVGQHSHMPLVAGARSSAAAECEAGSEVTDTGNGSANTAGFEYLHSASYPS